MKFVRYGNSYWEVDETRNLMINEVGGHTSLDPNLEIIEVENEDELDYSFLIDDSYETGWLSPDGRWYGCEYYSHEEVADKIFKSSGDDLKDKGWKAISRNYQNKKLVLYGAWWTDFGRRMTTEQINTLKQRELDYLVDTYS